MTGSLAASDVRSDRTPLVVDVDGTLVKTDLLHENVMQFIARHPFQSWRIAAWSIAGKSRLKHELASRVVLDLADVPLRAEVVTLIDEAHAAGRPVYLASASERGLVERLAERLGTIDGVFGTEVGVNLAGGAKAKVLNATFGTGGYDYIGDRPVDFAIWKSSRNVLAVSHGTPFTRRLLKHYPDATVVAQSIPALKPYIRALRPHQWAKNVLVFLSLFVGHHFDFGTVSATCLAFICFCCAASGSYILNDMLDLPADRDHFRKRHRPFAAGDLPIAVGVVLSAALLLAGLAASLLLPGRFTAIVSIYVVATFAYSFALKRRLLVDVVTLGGLYTIRVLGGIAAAASTYSPWLLMFSLLLFLSLAMVKRCSELIARRDKGKAPPPGRGYKVEDLYVLLPLAAAAGYGAALVVMLYLLSPEVRILYAHPNRLWLICVLVLYWISRVLVLCNRGDLHDDPVVFALTDRTSWVAGALAVVIIAVSV